MPLLPHHRRGLSLLLATPLVYAGIGLGLVPPTSAAVSCDLFDVIASADGVRVSVAQPGELLVESADAQGPAAQATANGLGISQAYAGAPYPGEAATSGVALAGQDPEQIPVYITSQFPSKREASRDIPSGKLVATSAEQLSTAEAKATSGADGQASAGTTTSTARAGCSETGDLVADATTDTEAASFVAGTLRLGRVRSEAHAVIGKDGKPVLSSSLTAGQTTVAGQTVGVTDKGIVYPGGSVPLSDNPLTGALAGAGISVTYVAAVPDSDGKGITAPGLRVETTRQVTGTGPLVTTYTFGRARARVSGEPGLPIDAEFGSTPTPTSGEFSPAGGDVGSTSTPGTFVPGTTTPGTFIPGTPASGGAVAAPAPESAPAGTATTVDVAALRDLELRLPIAGIYLALVVGAVAVFGGGALLRLIGVKLAWT